MLHAKFQDHRTSCSEEEDFLRFLPYMGMDGGHLGHVTQNIYKNFDSPFPRRLHIKFGFDWPSGFREELRSLKMVDGQTPTEGRRLDGYTISSPCEPQVSLKKG